MFILFPGFVTQEKQEAMTQFVRTTTAGFKQEEGVQEPEEREGMARGCDVTNSRFNMDLVKTYTTHISSAFLRRGNTGHSPGSGSCPVVVTVIR
jgi:hypothetical protein